MDIYRQEIIDHYKNPRNFGVLKNFDLRVFEVNRLCGDSIELFLKFSGNKLIDVSFRSLGCAISTASASLLMEEIKGKEIFSLGKIKEKEVLDLLGGKIMASRLKCAYLPLVALRKALNLYLINNKKRD